MPTSRPRSIGRGQQTVDPTGPFPVTQVSSHAVTVRLPVNFQISPTFHVSKVRLRPSDHAPGQKDDDLQANDGRVVRRTDDEEDVIEWNFASILDFGKADNGRWQYLVDWVGHPPSWHWATRH